MESLQRAVEKLTKGLEHNTLNPMQRESFQCMAKCVTCGCCCRYYQYYAPCCYR